MATPGKPTRATICLALLAGLVATPGPRPPTGAVLPQIDRATQDATGPTGLDGAPPEVRALLDRVLERLPEGGAGVAGYTFRQWEQKGWPVRASMGLKAVPGVDPDALIACVMDVDGYEGRIAHVDACRSRPDPAFGPPESVRFYQRIAVPGVARVQQELALVDAGTIGGYRVAYWYLLGPETEGLDPADGVRGAASVGAWLAAPGVVGYAAGAWPRRGDVNAVQWLSMTAGADALAHQVVEGAIDGMAAWSRSRSGTARDQSSPATRSTSTVRPPRRRTIATAPPIDQIPTSTSGPSAVGPSGPGSAMAGGDPVPRALVSGPTAGGPAGLPG